MKNPFDQLGGDENDTIRSLFVGRNAEMERLRTHFRGGGRTASINGPRGSGKTTLARAFGYQASAEELFPGGVQMLSTAITFSFFVFREARGDFSGLTAKSLFILDDFQTRGPELDRWLISALRAQPLLCLIFVGDKPYSVEGLSHLDLRLGGLTQEQFYELVARRVQHADRQTVDRIWSIAAGSPLFGNLAGMTVCDGIVTLQGLLAGLHDFYYPGILGPDGRPVPGDAIPERMRLEVSDTNAEILAPRKFEEIVADLLAQQGYTVELTPSSSDGGFDMYVAKKDNLGSFLYLVECKRYTPPNKVGVEIVRALHGVVQQQQANAGVIVTSSFFTKGAQELQQRVPRQLHLHDYIAIQKWLGII
jgi:restriction system protein